MTVNLPLLLLGIVLLWFPRQWMRLGRVIAPKRRRSTGSAEPWKREQGDPRLSYHEFAKPRNYFDLLRAAAGALAIFGFGLIDPALGASPEAGGGVLRQVLALKVLILLVGLLIQTVRWERQHLSFFAPIFFLAGITVGLCGPWVALFAFILVWALNPMFSNPEWFLTAYGVVLAGFAVVFGVSRLLAVGAFVMCFTPVLLSLLTRRPLVVFSRKPAHSA